MGLFGIFNNMHTADKIFIICNIVVLTAIAFVGYFIWHLELKMIIIPEVVLMIFIVMVATKSGRRILNDILSSSKKSNKYTPRRGWNEVEKEEVRIRQNGLCRKCGRPPPRWEYHHRDGNRSNNSLSNCEGLCPNCHSVKTHD